MADRIELRAVVVQPLTFQTAPQKTDVSFPVGEVQEIEIVVPDGHAGLTGIAMSQGNGAITIPSSGNVWLISNDEVLRFAYTDGLRNGSWQVYTYNQDFVNTHTFYLRFFVRENVVGQVGMAAPLSFADIFESGQPAATGAATSPTAAGSLPGGFTAGAGEGSPDFSATDAAVLQVGEDQLAADTGLLDQVAAGAQEDTADLSGVQFAVAPPQFGEGSV